MAVTEPTDSSSRDTSRPVPNSLSRLPSGFWSVFASTFLTVLFAEMGDKTQVATLLIAAESQLPWVVFTGAAIALVATSLLGVLFGQFVARRLPPRALELSVATLLLVIAALLAGDVVAP